MPHSETEHSHEHMHVHAPCVKKPALVHRMHELGILDDEADAKLHSTEGCGECPQAVGFGACAVLNTLKGIVGEEKAAQLIAQITTP